MGTGVLGKNGKSDFVWCSRFPVPLHLLISSMVIGELRANANPDVLQTGRGTLKGISKPVWVVWSRVFVANNKLNYDTGVAEVISLPMLRRKSAGI